MILPALCCALLLTAPPPVPRCHPVDRLCETFQEGYATLAPEKVAGLYHPDALFVTPGQAPQRGRRTMVGNFQKILSEYRAAGSEVRIRFEIHRRWTASRQVCDAGRYLLEVRAPGKPESITTGNFLHLFTQDARGTWGFDLDAYN